MLGRRLSIPEAIHPSDAIVVLGAGLINTRILRAESMRRIVRGMELYKQDLAPILIVLGDSDETELRAELAQMMGVPSDAITKIKTNTTTREESTRTAALLRQRNGHRIILVTESLHM